MQNNKMQKMLLTRHFLQCICVMTMLLVPSTL